MVANVLMLHGINHNMFGKRDPRQYGTATLADIDQALQALGEELGHRSRASRATSRAPCASASIRPMRTGWMPC